LSLPFADYLYPVRALSMQGHEMNYYTVYPMRGEHAVTVRARSEFEARLIAAIWYLSTPMRTDVLRPLKVRPARRQPLPCECVNDEELEKLANKLFELVNVAHDELRRKNSS